MYVCVCNLGIVSFPIKLTLNQWFSTPNNDFPRIFDYLQTVLIARTRSEGCCLLGRGQRWWWVSCKACHGLCSGILSAPDGGADAANVCAKSKSLTKFTCSHMLFATLSIALSFSALKSRFKGHHLRDNSIGFSSTVTASIPSSWVSILAMYLGPWNFLVHLHNLFLLQCRCQGGRRQ